MLVTSHVLAGAALGTVLRGHPATAFVAGVVSHAGMDACPHWGAGDRHTDPVARARFLHVARGDGCTGLAAMALAAGLSSAGARPATVAAMVGAALPDADKPCEHFLGFNPFPRVVREIHDRIQREAPHRLPHEVVAAGLLAVLAAWTIRRTGD
ncbi:MAG: hypothetical protein ACRDXE_05800 [Acidimicrobiales bacterium]